MEEEEQKKEMCLWLGGIVGMWLLKKLPYHNGPEFKSTNTVSI